jgi:hypothetical protein
MNYELCIFEFFETNLKLFSAFIENLPVLLADEEKATTEENHVEDR